MEALNGAATARLGERGHPGPAESVCSGAPTARRQPIRDRLQETLSRIPRTVAVFENERGSTRRTAACPAEMVLDQSRGSSSVFTRPHPAPCFLPRHTHASPLHSLTDCCAQARMGRGGSQHVRSDLVRSLDAITLQRGPSLSPRNSAARYDQLCAIDFHPLTRPGPQARLRTVFTSCLRRFQRTCQRCASRGTVSSKPLRSMAPHAASA